MRSGATGQGEDLTAGLPKSPTVANAVDGRTLLTHRSNGALYGLSNHADH